LINPGDGLFVEQVAADAVAGIGGIGNDAAGRQGLDDPAQKPFLGVIGVDAQ